MTLREFTDQQRRFARAFSGGGACCSTTCEECGRTYFLTAPGHGDYDPGELDKLRERAKAEPRKYIEVPDYTYIETAFMAGKNVVIGCSCDPTKEYSNWIEYRADELTRYLQLYWKEQLEEAEQKAKHARESLLALAPKDGKGDWQEMASAPKNATWVEVLLADGQTVQIAHWASDLSGEEQPPFEGWFRERGNEFVDVGKPIAWRPLPEPKP